MPTTRVYRDVKIYSGGYDLSGDTNQLKLSYAYDKVEVKHFGQECRYNAKGLARLAFDLVGNAYSNDDPAGSEDVLYARQGLADVPMTFCPLTGAPGEVGYFAKTMQADLEVGGAVGEMYAFTVAGEGENVPLVRGTMLATGAKTSTGNGTAYELGEITAGRKLYACLHVLAVAGTDPTLDLIIQSDDAEAFSSPLTRASFAQANAIGAQYLTPVAGPITDTWWRAKWTLGGTEPSFTIALCMGIQ